MKRRLLTIAVFLLLGAVVNVAVAWGCGEWSFNALSNNPESSRLPSDADWALSVPPDWPRPTHKMTVSGFGMTLGSLSAYTDRAVVYVQNVGHWGWPFRCLQSESHGCRTVAT